MVGCRFLTTVFILSGLIVFSGCRKQSTEADDPKVNSIDQVGLFFDDFLYSGAADPLLGQTGWTVRSGGGGPGPSNCSWDPSLVSFVADSVTAGNRFLQLATSTEGNGESTFQSEISSPVEHQFGTFAARIHFTDAPVSGQDGDGVVQTFFTITPWEFAYTDAYSEFDFEYLPNGGWGVSKTALWQTSWEKVGDSRSARQTVSHADTWHTLLIQTDTLLTRYYVDGELRVSHGDRFVADGLMSVNFNHWFIEASMMKQNSEKRTYAYLVDWVLVQSDSMISTEEVENWVETFRGMDFDRFDTLQ